MPAASIGHYASLSFVVIGRGKISDFGLRNANWEMRNDHSVAINYWLLTTGFF